MRWDELKVDEQQRRALPGFKDDAVVRTFDAPEALETRFYEIRAKSAINRVPERSRMPFRYTINPYRGCSHACTYCQVGDTPVLMGDGRTKPIAALRPGDTIYGTVRVGQYRRYALTEVLDHWKVTRLAFRVTLDDGTQLITSGDHRFLSDRGWKHVTNTRASLPDRPHLTTTNHLVGTGAFAPPPEKGEDYRRGYLAGMIRGDAYVSHRHAVLGRQRGRTNVFRLALTDFEALRRTEMYLTAIDVATTSSAFKVPAGYRPMRAISAYGGERLRAVTDAIDWPSAASRGWCKGFLAGVFDAEGSFGQVIRISNSDERIISWIEACLTRLGFQYVVEQPRQNGVRNVRLRGGLAAALRFFHLTDPAITRKRSIEGRMVKTFGRLKVASIERLTYMPLYDITTGTGDFIANGVVSHNCFARPTHTFLDFDAGRDFEKEIVVKVNAPELVRRELSRPSWKGEHVALGTNTDPYQWVEGRYKLMPGIWEAMRDHANPCSILTKSPLVLRDKDLLVQINERAPVSASFSVPTLEEKAWRASEPHTPHPRARLEAVAELNRLGIPTGILIAPLMPGINDDPKQVERIIEIASEAGAVSIGGIGLHLRGEVRDVFMDWLRSYRPDLVDHYEQLYARGAYLPNPEKQRIAGLVRARSRFTREHVEDSERRAMRWRERAMRRAESEPSPEAPVEQPTLF